MVAIGTVVAIALGCLIGGGVAGAGIAGAFKKGDTTTTIVDVQDVEQERTDQQAIEAETDAEVCKDGPLYDAQACVMVDLCQMQAAEGGQMAKVCDVVVNLWVSGEIWEKCEAHDEEIKRARCYATVGARK